jgi:hypothetical protein
LYPAWQYIRGKTRIDLKVGTGSFGFLCNTEPKTKAKEAPADPKDKEKGKAAEQPVESISSDKEMISALRHGMRGN